VIKRRERTKPQHTSLYVRFHFAERGKASFFVAALASVPLNPSTANMRGVKVRRRTRQASAYLSFFLLVLGQDLVRILAAVVWSVGICDVDVKDSCCSVPP
jgi:hypothetical protein